MKRFAIRLVLLTFVGMGLAFSGCQIEKPAGPPPRAQEPVVRVKIAGPVQTIPLAVDGPFSLNLANKQVAFRSAAMTASSLKMEGDVLCIGKRRVKIDEFCDIVPDYDGTISVDYRYYRGFLRVYPSYGGQFIVVNHVRIESYLPGVLPGELPRLFSSETYKALAIAARTFALYEKYTVPGRKQWDVLANEGSQMYLGKSAETAKSVSAVQATYGIVLTAELPGGSKIFPAYYSSTCGGWTQPAVSLANVDPSIRPLRGAVRCTSCNISPHYTWTGKSVSLADLTDSMNSRGVSASPLKGISAVNVIARTPYGHITKIEIVDITGQRVVLPAQRFRLIAGARKMPSTWCDIRIEGPNVVFNKGHGLGHGVGMCQWGAEGMARRGFTAKEIVLHYYPNARLKRAY